MRLLASWPVIGGQKPRTIELLLGDLAQLPPEHAADVLVVSAFPNDYSPTPTSLIGALDDAGVSVAALAQHKAHDLREEFSCWLSQPIENQAFQRIITIESGWNGQPPEITDDLFQALNPFLLGELPEITVATPILGTGDAGWPTDVMFRSIVTCAASWMRRGLPLRTLKIVAYSAEDARTAAGAFAEILQAEIPKRRGPVVPTWLIDKLLAYAQKAASLVLARGRDGPTPTRLPRPSRVPPPPSQPTQPPRQYDIFLSYAHDDMPVANALVAELRERRPGIRIFQDTTGIQAGAFWMERLADAIDAASSMVALYSPTYWQSKFCKLEFAAGLTRQMQFGALLFPIYYEEAKIPTLYGMVQFHDCREKDMAKINAACDDLLAALDSA